MPRKEVPTVHQIRGMYQPRIILNRQSALYDEAIGILVKGAKPNSQVRLTNDVRLPKTGLFTAAADFATNGDGFLDVAKQAPEPGGSYQGMDGMGLFSSLAPGPGTRYGSRFSPTHPRLPIQHTIRLWTEDATKPAAEATLFRHLMGPGGAKTVGLIDMFGTGGGVMEHRAALLASRGFVVLALGLAAYKDRPKTFYEPLHLEYVLDAARWLRSQSFTLDGQIGIVGSSFGGLLAILAGVHSQDVGAVVTINSNHCLYADLPIYFRGKQLPSVQSDPAGIRTENGLLYVKDWQRDDGSRPELVLPMEKSEPGTRFLIAAAGDDASADSVSAERIFRNAMARNNRLRDFESIIYPEAGHLLEPPYQPFCPYSYWRLFDSVGAWGGQLGPHSKAQVDLWMQMRRFFEESLGDPLRGKI